MSKRENNSMGRKKLVMRWGKKKSLNTSKEKNDGDIWIKNNETNFMQNENLRKVENKKPNIMEEILYYEKS